jgi:uncharacterized membrane protein
VSTTRLEAFSDAVIAVAITLLVLDIRVPPTPPGTTLASALGHQWPHYVAYATSFVTIGIIWINHHAMIGRLRVANHAILVLNLLLLLSIALLPFATSLMAAYVNQSAGQHLAAVIYAGSFLFMAILFSALNAYTLVVRPQMLDVDLSANQRRRVLTRSIIGVGPYLLATVLAVVSAYVTLGLCAGLAAYYAFPTASGGGQPKPAG